MGVSYLVVLIYAVRIAVRDILVPLYEFSGFNLENNAFLRISFDANILIAGLTDFFASVMLLLLFYSYSDRPDKIRSESNFD